MLRTRNAGHAHAVERDVEGNVGFSVPIAADDGRVALRALRSTPGFEWAIEFDGGTATLIAWRPGVRPARPGPIWLHRAGCALLAGAGIAGALQSV